MIWLLPLLPIVAGVAMWALPQPSRRTLGLAGGGSLLATLALALPVAIRRASGALDWGAGLVLHLEADHLAGVVAVLVPVIALAVVAYAVAHEEERGLPRLVGLLVVFVGAMELLVVAGDLLTLLIAWEVVGWLSWGLIGHDWRERDDVAAAGHAFNVTRFGDLGLFAAAGAAWAGVGSLAYADLGGLTGGWLHVLVAGMVLAAVAKSAQVPFSPWLFSAMAGPTPVSALLHAATMVAAGAYILARLHDTLAMAHWFGPTVIGVGLVTALVGGVVATVQSGAKELLAASTSAHYGLMFVAIGAGYASIGVAHLVTHAAFKAALFLVAGIGIAAVGSGDLGRMRLGRVLPRVATASAVAALALAAVPPLGGAWTKEEVIAAAGHEAPWLAVLMIVAGGLSAFYAARFHLLAFGRTEPGPRDIQPPTRVEVGAVASLAAVSVGLGALWLPDAKDLVEAVTGGQVPAGEAWELVASLVLVGLAVYGAYGLNRSDRLATLGWASGVRAAVGDWLRIPALTRVTVVDPFISTCRGLARFDDRVVDAGVRGAARVADALAWMLSRIDVRDVDAVPRALARATGSLSRGSATASDPAVDRTVEGLAGAIGFVARDSRRVQTGLAHHYYVIVTVGLLVAVATAAIWRG